MATQNVLKKYSYSMLAIAGIIFLYSMILEGNCMLYGKSVYTDFCKLSGLSYWNFYGMPIAALALIGLLLPKLTESEKLQKFTLFFLGLSTARFVYIIISAFLTKSV